MQKQVEYQKNIDEANDLLAEWKQSYNALSEEEKAEFDKEGIPDLDDAEDAYDVFRIADGSIVMQDEDDSLSFRTEEWDDNSKTESALLSEGYIRVETENQNNKIYVLYSQNSCITADLSTHHFRALYFDDGESKSDEKIGGWKESGAGEAALTIILDRLSAKFTKVQQYAELQQSTAEAWMRIYRDNTDLLARLEAQGDSFSEIAQKAAREAEKAKRLADAFDILGKLISKVLLVVDLIQLGEDVDYCMTMSDEVGALRGQYSYLLQLASNSPKCKVNGFPGLLSAIDDLENKLMQLKVALGAAMGNIIIELASLMVGPAGLASEIMGAVGGVIINILKDISKTGVENAYNTVCSLISAIEDTLIGCGIDVERYYFPGKRRKKIDPSGYVYEAVPGNKLSDVTVTAFYSANPDGSDAVIWDAEEFDQENPLFTDTEGHYEWFVPEGYWQVRCEKDGYLAAYSDWLPVPPPQTDVNIPMISLETPKLLYANAYSDSVEFEFSQYMDPDSFNHQTIKITVDGQEVNGNVIPLNLESSPNGKYYTKRFAFIPDDGVQLGGTVNAFVKSVQNYAGSVIDDEYQKSLAVGERVTEIVCDETLNFKYGESASAVLQINPAAAAARKVLTVTVDNTSVLETKTQKVTVNNEGKAVVDFNLLLPGEAKVTYKLDGTDISAKSKATVIISKGQLPRVTASIESGSTVSKGTKLELFCDNPDAKIYYTLDLSCPCQENNTKRKLYTGPIEITEDTQLIAYAILDGYEDGKTRLFTYTVSNSLIGDVNRDGTVDILDATVVQKYAVDMTTLTNEQKELGDVNNDKIVDILDATMIQKYAVDKITAFPKAA